MSQFNVVRRKPRTESAEASARPEPPIVADANEGECAMPFELVGPWRPHSSLEGCQNMSFRRK